MATFQDLVFAFGPENLRYILPFLLVFTIIYAILAKTKILGGDENKKSFNVIVALVMALAFVVPSITGEYAYQNDPVRILNDAIPGVAIVTVAILMVLLVIGAFGKNLDISENKTGGIFAWFGVGAVAAIFLIAAGYIRNLPYWLDWLAYSYNQTLIVSLLVLGIVIWFIVRDPENDTDDDSPGIVDLLDDRDS